MIKKYRKKPVVIEAMQLTNSNALEIINWVNGELRKQNKKITCDIFGEPQQVSIETLEGTMYASIGDYIIKGVNGEFYPCKANIFEKTYEEVE